MSCKDCHEGMLVDSNAEDKIVVLMKETTLLGQGMMDERKE